LRAQRIDKWLPCPADSRRLGGTSGKNHFDVGARLGGRGRDGCDEKRRPTCHHQGTNEASDSASDHV
jgi:hypothetical protein